MGSYRLMTPETEEVLDAMGGMVDAVASYKNEKNAVGYSFLYYVNEMAANEKIKLLTVDGVSPERENVANKTYPYSSEFYAITAGNRNPNTASFIKWMTSEQGQALVEKVGYTKLD